MSSTTLKPRIVLANAFSTNMLSNTAEVRFVPVTLEFVKELIQFARERGIEITSIIGHESTAKLLSQLLSINVQVNRTNYKFEQRDLLIVFTIPVRLPEGKVLTTEELREYASKLNIYAVVKIYPTYYGYDVALSPINELLIEFREYLKSRGLSELAQLAETIRTG